eukprot:Sspe_Gene.108942::Locus_88184_Transcript_1_2_Confidence_0.667_Length_835::g.108942::m.108942
MAEALPPLHRAAREGNVEEVLRLLDGGAGVNTDSGPDWEHPVTLAVHLAPLHCAAESGEQKVVEALIAAGGIANARDSDGTTPLGYASSAGAADALIAAGADVGATDVDSCTCLHHAVQRGKVEVAQRIVQEAPGLVNTPAVFATLPLHYAASSGDAAMARILCEAGASIASIATSNTLGAFTPVHIAAAYGHCDVLREFHKFGDLTVVGDQGRTPMHSAARGGHLEAIRLLHQLGVHFTRSSVGTTPRDDAQDSYQNEAVTLIRNL